MWLRTVYGVTQCVLGNPSEPTLLIRVAVPKATVSYRALLPFLPLVFDISGSVFGITLLPLNRFLGIEQTNIISH